MSAKLEKYLKKVIKRIDLSEIVDIIIFGSAVKGKEFPEDIDLCIIFRKKENIEVANDISNKLKNLNVHISTLTIDNFFKKPHSLAKTIFLEGKSIFTGKSVIGNLGFSSATLYSYNLSKLEQSEKVRFVYLLKGRKDEMGIVKRFKGEWLADSCFMIPVEKDDEMLQIFKKWKVPFTKKEVFIH